MENKQFCPFNVTYYKVYIIIDLWNCSKQVKRNIPQYFEKFDSRLLTQTEFVVMFVMRLNFFDCTNLLVLERQIRKKWSMPRFSSKNTSLAHLSIRWCFRAYYSSFFIWRSKNNMSAIMIKTKNPIFKWLLLYSADPLNHTPLIKNIL